MSSLNCINCNCAIVLDESLAEKYPEWKAIVNSKAKSSTTVLCDKSGTKVMGAESRAASASSALVSRSGTGSDFSQLSAVESLSLDGNLGHALVQQGNLHNMLCDDNALPIDHPMCEECCEKLDEAMGQQLSHLKDECESYQKLLETQEQSKKVRDNTGLDVSTLRRRLTEIQSDEKALRMELAHLEAEEREIDKKTVEEKKLLDRNKMEEERLWKINRDQLRKLMELEEEEKSLDNQLKYVNEQLDILTKTNIFNLAFHIWPTGRFGTINGLKLGRLPDDKVEWAEINAAWGQVALLMHSLSNKIELIFDRFEIVPFGAYSYIKWLDKGGKELPLHHTGSLMGDSKFDAAMSAFLDCLKQLQDLMKKDGNVSLPYEIRGSKADGGRLCICGDKGKELSIRLQLNCEERWTQAMKYILMDLKWALTWVASRPV